MVGRATQMDDSVKGDREEGDVMHPGGTCLAGEKGEGSHERRREMR